MAETIYIDTCALNRITDDQSQLRVRLEADAMARIFDLVAAGGLIWLASTALQFEISRNPDPVRREGALKLLSNSTSTSAPDRSTLERATRLTRTALLTSMLSISPSPRIRKPTGSSRRTTAS